jgi:Polyketide cyclase / dehydrase and lipid transport.
MRNTSEPFRFITAAAIPPLIGTALVYLGTVFIGQLGWVMFLLLPSVLGFASAVIYSVGRKVSFLRCWLVGLATIVVIGLLIVFTAVEGLICLLMALPLAVPLLTIGSLVGWISAKPETSGIKSLPASAVLFACLPFLMGFEASQRSAPTVHRVVTTVVINAPIEKVWENVVSFPEIQSEPDGILSLGFAYPINARIEGEGVGAIRHCNFNTGPFVEPITAWEAPHLLAFDVAEQPAPMTELSPYKDLRTSHLEFIRSQKGQFRLFEKDGKTVVEGTTFLHPRYRS